MGKVTAIKTGLTGFTGFELRGNPVNPVNPVEEKPWPRVKLVEVCEIVLGGTPKTAVDAYWNGNIPWLTPGEMGKITGPYVEDTKRKLTEKGLQEGSSLFPARSVILSTRAPIGYVFINKVPMCTNQGCKTLVPSPEVLPEYLYFNLLGRTDELNQLGTGTTFKELATSALKNIELPLPPLAVQHEIVARLEKDLAMVERMAKGFEAQKAEADQLFKSTLKETFEEVSRGGAETRRSKLDNVCELIADYPHTTAKNEGKGFPLVRTPNVGYTRLIYENMHRVSEEVYASRTSRGVPMEGDLIFAREAPAGNVAVIQKGEVVCLGQRTVLLRLKSGGAVPDYMAWYILSPEIQKTLLKCSYGATVAHVNVKDIRDLEVGIPPLPTQRKIVAKLDAVRERCEKLKRAAEEG